MNLASPWQRIVSKPAFDGIHLAAERTESDEIEAELLSGLNSEVLRLFALSHSRAVADRLIRMIAGQSENFASASTISEKLGQLTLYLDAKAVEWKKKFAPEVYRVSSARKSFMPGRLHSNIPTVNPGYDGLWHLETEDKGQGMITREILRYCREIPVALPENALVYAAIIRAHDYRFCSRTVTAIKRQIDQNKRISVTKIVKALEDSAVRMQRQSRVQFQEAMRQANLQRADFPLVVLKPSN